MFPEPLFLAGRVVVANFFEFQELLVNEITLVLSPVFFNFREIGNFLQTKLRDSVPFVFWQGPAACAKLTLRGLVLCPGLRATCHVNVQLEVSYRTCRTPTVLPNREFTPFAQFRWQKLACDHSKINTQFLLDVPA